MVRTALDCPAFTHREPGRKRTHGTLGPGRATIRHGSPRDEGPGDWIVPTFNGEPRYHKPILIYWLMGLSTALAGDTPFGVRIVSTLAGTGTCLLVWGMGRRILGKRGFLAALMLAVSPIMVAESKLATTDATLMFWMVGGLYCLFELASRPSKVIAGLFWACLGLACLTKGPVAPFYFLAATAMAWLWGWPVVHVWKRLHAKQGLVGFAVLTIPWYLAISLATRGEFIRLPSARRYFSAPPRDGRARRVSRLLLRTVRGGLLSLVGTGSGGGLGSLDAAEKPPRAWFVAGLGDRSLDPSRVLANPAAPLLLAGLPSVCTACRLDGGGPCKRGSHVPAMGSGTPGHERSGRYRHRGDGGLAGGLRDSARSLEVAPGDPVSPDRAGDVVRHASPSRGGDPAGHPGIGGNLGADHAAHGGLADSRSRTLSNIEPRGPAAGGTHGPDRGRAGSAQLPGARRDLCHGPSGRLDRGTQRAFMSCLTARAHSSRSSRPRSSAIAFPDLFGIEVQPIENVEGFSLTKGKNHSLELVIVRTVQQAPRSEESTARTITPEQPLVK